jgi:hypothetical protein
LHARRACDLDAAHCYDSILRWALASPEIAIRKSSEIDASFFIA